MPASASTATPPSDIAVNLEQVTKRYLQWQRSGEVSNTLKNLLRPEQRVVVALNQVSFQVRQGEFVAYAGANGAGKSTTLKILAGMLHPETGKVEVLGYDPLQQRIPLMRELGVLFGNRTELWWDLPIQSSFAWKKVIWDIPEATYQHNLEQALEMLELKPLLNTFARELSLGQRMRADLALLLLHSPKLIILDEPTLGLDVLAKRRMIDYLKQLNREKGVTVLITSHDMDDLEEMAGRLLLLSHGELAFDGTFDALRKLTTIRRHITVTTDSQVAPELERATWLRSDGFAHLYEVNSDPRNMRLLLGELAEQPGLVDIETGKAPIEAVVAELYRRWR